MAEHDPTVLGIALSVMKYPSKDFRLSRIIPVDVSARLIGRHLRRDHEGGCRVDERYSSNIRFQHAACRSAVSVITPSRSRRTASYRSRVSWSPEMRQVA